MATDRIILGIDPGTNIMGYGIIACQGKTFRVLALGVLKLGRIEAHGGKLKKIFERTQGLIDEFHADELAIEAPFFGKNVQSMLKLGRAQGVAIAAALHRRIEYYEYSPRKIKQSITGRGEASKEQVAAMLGHMMPLPDVPETLDATDGLAVAVCHALQGFTMEKQRYGGWDSFLKNNPGRLK
ncbi:MAG TPA: crossover junction endodeoxyribonuclease RuvC [Bacteroidales bacterium]|nr:crossover junction endodeoxyribonuclease RuvC [Bacteroidales bacterium]HRZ77360.1 crossover junction endodeoxyribonuclease RuvC [Bacteroidales bacterium]